MKPKILSGSNFLSIYKFTGGAATIVIWQYHFQIGQQKYGERHVSEVINQCLVPFLIKQKRLHPVVPEYGQYSIKIIPAILA